MTYTVTERLPDGRVREIDSGLSLEEAESKAHESSWAVTLVQEIREIELLGA